MITFPIYESKYGDIIGIGQVGATFRFSKLMPNYLHQNEVQFCLNFQEYYLLFWRIKKIGNSYYYCDLIN